MPVHRIAVCEGAQVSEQWLQVQRPAEMTAAPTHVHCQPATRARDSNVCAATKLEGLMTTAA